MCNKLLESADVLVAAIEELIFSGDYNCKEDFYYLHSDQHAYHYELWTAKELYIKVLKAIDNYTELRSSMENI